MIQFILDHIQPHIGDVIYLPILGVVLTKQYVEIHNAVAVTVAIRNRKLGLDFY